MVPTPDPHEVARARDAVSRVLDKEDIVTSDLARYYDPEGPFVGATFDAPDPNLTDVTPFDLVAVSSMNVDMPALAVRHLLDEGVHRSAVLDALPAVDDVPLWEASDDRLEIAMNLHRVVKRALSVGNRWVTASKLTARKRPSLMPVRDSVIVRGLGLANKDAMGDWLTMREVVRDAAVRERLLSAARASSRDLTEIPTLRLLDAALWMAWRKGGSLSDG